MGSVEGLELALVLAMVKELVSVERGTNSVMDLATAKELEWCRRWRWYDDVDYRSRGLSSATLSNDHRASRIECLQVPFESIATTEMSLELQLNMTFERS
jgi:hypothetical protein